MDAESNPYAPPASRLEAPEAPPAAEELASSGQRLSNLLLDTLGTYVFAFLSGSVSRSSTRAGSGFSTTSASGSRSRSRTTADPKR